jgi:putative transposase
VVRDRIDALDSFRKQLEGADVDLLREMVKVFAEQLMGADADAVCGADYGERSAERTNRRNGYRERAWDTRAGTIALQVPKLREGTYFPEWLLEPRRRAERAFVQVVAECYVRGVSTRRVEGLVRQLGIERLSKSRVSEMARELDRQVEAFRTRPLDRGPYTYLWLDALTQKVREGGRIVNVACVVATAVSAEGTREILDLDIHTTEDGAGWTAFLRGLISRGLQGVRLVISDAHPGLVDAIASTLPGASWQRCRTHFVRNLLTKVPKAAQPFVASAVRSIFDQPDAETTHAQHARVLDQLTERFGAAAELLEQAGPDILAFTSFPGAHWRQIRSNNPQERLNKEIRRRTDVVGIFPNRASVIRLVGMVLCEQHDEWAVGRRYMSAESLARARLEVIEGEVLEEVRGELVAAS